MHLSYCLHCLECNSLYCPFFCHCHNNAIVSLSLSYSSAQSRLFFALRAGTHQCSWPLRALKYPPILLSLPLLPQLTQLPRILPNLNPHIRRTPSKPHINRIQSSPKYFVRNEVPPQFAFTKCLHSCPFSPSRLSLFSPPRPRATWSWPRLHRTAVPTIAPSMRMVQTFHVKPRAILVEQSPTWLLAPRRNSPSWENRFMVAVRAKSPLPPTHLQPRTLSGWSSILSKEVVRLETRQAILEQIIPPPLLTRTHTIIPFLQASLRVPTLSPGLGSTR